MGKVKEYYDEKTIAWEEGISKEDYDFLAWENSNLSAYLENVLGYGMDLIGQIANGNIKQEKK